MNYNYCDENILQSPQKYMYTKFGGIEFLKSYYQQRLKIINKIYSYTQGDNESNIKLHDDLISGVVNYISTEKIKLLNEDLYSYILNQSLLCSVSNETSQEINVKEKIKTDDLLRKIILILSHSKGEKSALIELDQLIQRFEVTKKIYSEYKPGFKKGSGDNQNLENYWLFGIALCYANFNKINLKYFNTLIKVCDLLASLEIKILLNQITKKGLLLLFIIENHIYKSLIDYKGISLDS